MSTPVSIGIDLGTSELKAILLDEEGRVIGHAGVLLATSRPQPGWAEQDPEDWWQASVRALRILKSAHPEAFDRVCCIGLCGQMHGAVLVDANGKSIRPAILWNDARASYECTVLDSAVPRAAEIVGSIPMAGLTAPKLLWIKHHEPHSFDAIDCVLSPKDYLRFKITGERLTDMSDAAGTLWLDVRNRRWYEPMIHASGLQLSQMPQLVEGNDIAGKVSSAAAKELGLTAGLIVAGGGGDNPVSAVGLGAINVGDSFITLGTSAAVVSVTDSAVSGNASAVHGYCHALPNRWYAMGAILSGASCLRWATQLLSHPNEQSLLNLIAGSVPFDEPIPQNAPIFLPYLSGERTPYNDPDMRGVFVNLGHDTSPGLLGFSVIEGVGFALRDAMQAISIAGANIGRLSLVGGGARSEYWAQLLANIIGRDISSLVGSELAGCVGAAKLAFWALRNRAPALQENLPLKETFSPDPGSHEAHQLRYDIFRRSIPLSRIN